MRLFAISDIHTDFGENRALVRAVSSEAFREDALIVAGDVADEVDVILGTLAELKERFAEVFFVPGNHELWLREGEGDSLTKFHDLMARCADVGVQTAPRLLGRTRVVPLFSWYDADFCGPLPDVSVAGWKDFALCKWPADVPDPAAHFASLNRLDLPLPAGGVTVTFSHYLPRPDLLPSLDRLRFKGLAKVSGSARIERQLREAGSTVHVSGHTHINHDVERDGVRYVQNALGYPRERLHAGAGGLPVKLLLDVGV